ncbi:unnamed protein product [Acanthoscelides obtectus]|uniref:Uncharacterized protein n=1 Tax=Acanthoscelides obtectus TaxID=200917 RepID=A0A9P0VUT3_ACAOB|nr:unnamed protein product [Acanthoscelides obtectus]CAK1675481.1 hypothetical protein AOBTE_LOCUS30247 [Acanthoscelides obtectus]
MSPRPSIVPLDTGDSPTSDIESRHDRHATRGPSQGTCKGQLQGVPESLQRSPAGPGRSCAECSQRVCEDCASYSKMDDGRY